MLCFDTRHTRAIQLGEVPSWIIPDDDQIPASPWLLQIVDYFCGKDGEYLCALNGHQRTENVNVILCILTGTEYDFNWH
jgi:hypothetical protein